jgi:hypothetical protein
MSLMKELLEQPPELTMGPSTRRFKVLVACKARWRQKYPRWLSRQGRPGPALGRRVRFVHPPLSEDDLYVRRLHRRVGKHRWILGGNSIGAAAFLIHKDVIGVATARSDGTQIAVQCIDDCQSGRPGSRPAAQFLSAV